MSKKEFEKLMRKVKENNNKHIEKIEKSSKEFDEVIEEIFGD